METTSFIQVQEVDSPVVITVPHDGVQYSDIGECFRARKFGIKVPDRYVAQLVEGYAGTMSSTVIRMLLPRWYLDVNRERTYVVKGKQRFPCDDERLWAVYDEYHRTVLSYISRAIEKFSKALLIDLHSYPSQLLKTNADYQVILGTCNRTTVSTNIDVVCATLFRNQGLSVFLPNEQPSDGKKFPGGYTIRLHHSDKVQAVQIEFRDDILVRPGVPDQIRSVLSDLSRCL